MRCRELPLLFNDRQEGWTRAQRADGLVVRQARFAGLSILISIGLAAVVNGQTLDPVTKAVRSAPGWRIQGTPSVHTVEDIHRAEPTLSLVLKRYGFDMRTRAQWIGSSGDVRSTVYRMTDPAASFGLFSIGRDADAPGYARFPFGVEGYAIEDRAVFWAGRYVVELEGDAKAAKAWAELAAPEMSGPSVRPSVVEHLPVENRVADSEAYVVSAASMDKAWGVDPSRLGFDRSAEAAVARYRIKGKPVRLLLLMYPTQQMAIKHEEVFASVSGKAGRLKKRAGPLLAFADASGDDEAAAAVLDSVRHEFQVTWNEAAPDKKVVFFIIGMFKLVGAAVGIAVAGGVLFAGFRLYCRWRYPNRVFDRDSGFELIQLKLNKGFRDRSGKASPKP